MVPATAACLTIHKFNSITLKTISVEKKCARDCQADMVGCSSPVLHSHKSDTVKMHQYVRVSWPLHFISPTSSFPLILTIFIFQTCTYCCNRNYCNFDIASSSQAAFNLTQDALFKSNTSSRQTPVPLTTLSVLFLFLTVFALFRFWTLTFSQRYNNSWSRFCQIATRDDYF